MRKIGIIALLVGLIMFFCNAFAFSQETSAPAQEYPQLEWLWGEVVSVDLGSNKVTIKYPDYETEQDKEITLSVDEKTQYNNVSSLADIKPQDTLSIDYRVTVTGDSVAENISLDKPDENSQDDTDSISPDDMQQQEQQEAVSPEESSQ